MMPALSLKQKRELQVFFVAYGVWLVFSILNISLTYFGGGGNTLNKAIRAGAIFVLVIYEVINSRDRYFSIPALVMVGLVLLGGFLSSEMALVEATIFVVCASRIPFDSIVRCTYWIIGITCAVIILCSLIGIVPNAEVGTVRVGGGDGTRPRYTLGFLMPSYAPRFLATISMLYFWVNKEKSTWIIFIAIAALNVGLYQATDTRVGYYLVWLILAIALLGKLRVFHITRLPFSKQVVPFSFVIVAALAIGLTLAYDPSSVLMTSLDQLLSTRLQLGFEAVQEYGFSFFGQRFESAGNKWVQGELVQPERVMVVDSSYVHLAISQGIATLLIIVAGFTLVAKRLCDQHEDIRVGMLICVSLICFIDGQLWLLYYNPFLFLLSSYILLPPEKRRSQFKKLRWKT